MSECVVRMEMPKVCITSNGFLGYCPMDRLWCIQRNAPKEIKMKEAYDEMTDNIPEWCPILAVLPEEHGELIDRQAVYEKIKWWKENTHDTVTKAMLHEFYVMLFTVPFFVPETERRVNDGTD